MARNVSKCSLVILCLHSPGNYGIDGDALSVELVVGQVVVGVSLGGAKESFSGRTSSYYPLNDGAWHNVTLVMDVNEQVRGVWAFKFFVH